MHRQREFLRTVYVLHLKTDPGLNGDIYVGSSINPRRRLAVQKNASRCTYHPRYNSKLQTKVRETGPDNWSFTLRSSATCDAKRIEELELRLQERLRPSLNENHASPGQDSRRVTIATHNKKRSTDKSSEEAWF